MIDVIIGSAEDTTAEVVTRAFRSTRKTSLCSMPRESSLLEVPSTSLRDAYQRSLSSVWRLHRQSRRNYVSVAGSRCPVCCSSAHGAVWV